MSNLATLRPFKKGDPRINMKGRPKKGEPISEFFRELLDCKDPDERLRRKTVIFHKLYEQAKAGSIFAAKMLLDRAYGQPLQTTEIKDITANPILEMFNNFKEQENVEPETEKTITPTTQET